MSKHISTKEALQIIYNSDSDSENDIFDDVIITAFLVTLNYLINLRFYNFYLKGGVVNLFFYRTLSVAYH